MSLLRFVAALSVVLVFGCGEQPEPQPLPQATDSAPSFETAPAQPPSPVAKIREDLGIGKSGELKKVGDSIVAANLGRTKVENIAPLAGQQLREIDLHSTRVSDLSPLVGQPVEVLYAEETAVESLEPLKDLPLSVLYLSNTKISDLSPIAGKPFSELNLVDTLVSDLKPLSESSLGTVWLRRCPVSDLSPLSKTGLVSLDVGETMVADLSPLASCVGLKRLHIAETDVVDLTPLAGLQLERLIFSPWKIEAGLDAIRAMSTLQQLDVSFDDQGQALRPEEFWKRWDAGDIKPPGE